MTTGQAWLNCAPMGPRVLPAPSVDQRDVDLDRRAAARAAAAHLDAAHRAAAYLELPLDPAARAAQVAALDRALLEVARLRGAISG